MDELNPAQIGAFKEILQKRLEATEEALVSARERSGTVKLDQQSTGRVTRGDALQQQAMANANVAQYEQQIREIRRALKRIEMDDFGFCVECDEPIAPKRLEARPEVPLCIACQSQREASGN